jgi:hypothetical protein
VLQPSDDCQGSPRVRRSQVRWPTETERRWMAVGLATRRADFIALRLLPFVRNLSAPSLRPPIACWSAQRGSRVTPNRLLLAAIAALAFAGAAHAQETDSHVASTGEQGFRRFASLCRDQRAACDAAFRFGALAGADAAMRCALAGDRIACFKNTM